LNFVFIFKKVHLVHAVFGLADLFNKLLQSM